jgi:hypothetical protein
MGAKTMPPPMIDPRRIEQLKQQKEMQALEQRVRLIAQHRAMGGGGDLARENEEGDLHEERLRAYADLAASVDAEQRDTVEDAEEGIIDGGTWEHRKRAAEMLKTAQTSLELTQAGTGAHHMADFLPKQELENFLGRAKAASSGQLLEAQARGAKIDSRNLGFQMMQKAGWTEGQGLGASATGAVNPVAANMGMQNAGVGTEVVSLSMHLFPQVDIFTSLPHDTSSGGRSERGRHRIRSVQEEDDAGL